MLPYDVLEHNLFPILTVDQLLVLRQVCSDLKDAIDSSSIWLRLYCQQFHAPPAIPCAKAQVSFLMRRKARLLRIQSSDQDDYFGNRGNSLGEIAHEVRIDWTRPPLPGPVAVQESRYDFDCYDLNEPVRVEAGLKVERPATLPCRHHLFGGAHIKKVGTMKGAIAVLTMEGEIRVVYDYDPDLDVMFSPQIYTPENGGRFVDLEIENTSWFSKLLAIDDRGAIHLWELNELGEPPIKFEVLTGVMCHKLAPAHNRDALVFKNQSGVHIRTRSKTMLLSSDFVDDFICLRTNTGFNIIMLMEDRSVQVAEIMAPNNSRDPIRHVGSHRLECIDRLSHTRDRLYMFAQACDGTEVTDPMVWVLTEQGRLIECRLQKSGPVAQSYPLTGIVNVSMKKSYSQNEYYAHHWDGSTFWLRNGSAKPIEGDPITGVTSGSESVLVLGMPPEYSF